MPSTYSTSLRLELQADGENSGTWGQKTNTNLGTLLEQAIAGRTTVNVGGGVDVTLTATNGSSDQARNLVIELTGTLTANINVIVPTATKSWIFYNNTSGSFSLTVKPSAGTGVAIPQGGKMLVYCDGTNVVTGLTAFSNVTLTTPTIIGSGGTLTLPAGPDTLVGRATTDTLTNKTLSNPTASGSLAGGWTGGTFTSPTFGGSVGGAHGYSGNLSFSGTATFNKQTVGAPVAGSSSGTWTPDFSLGNNFSLSLAGALTVANPTNAVAGQSGVIFIATNGQTTNWGANFKWPNGAVGGSSGGVDVYSYYVQASNYIVIAQTRAVA
jgi:hypothetical protein